MLDAIEFAAVAHCSEIAELAWQHRISHEFHLALAMPDVADQICDGNQLQLMGIGEFTKCGTTHHRSIIVNQFADPRAEERNKYRLERMEVLVAASRNPELLEKLKELARRQQQEAERQHDDRRVGGDEPPQRVGGEQHHRHGHDDRDVHDPVALAGTIHCTDEERAHFQGLIELGLSDAFRLFNSEGKLYSWWDYREMAFRRNRGLRIDHVLVSGALQTHCTGCVIDKAPRKNERPSDHAPVVLELGADALS